jgi:ABC-type nitrate/sulfonate/bicarbonate transport system ATPase subunit
MESLIEIEDLGIAYERDGTRTRVLAGLDLTITRGEFVAMSDIGVGKSTLLRVLAGIPSRARTRAGSDPTGHRAPVALVFQDSPALASCSCKPYRSTRVERHARGERQRRAQAMASTSSVWRLGATCATQLSADNASASR